MSPNVDTRAIEPNSVDTSIRDMMLQKLPQELYDLIEHYFYELVFTPGAPGYIYPLGKPKDAPEPEAKAYDRRPKARPLLLCLSKDIYHKYRERVYAENTFVWGSGQRHWLCRRPKFSILPASLELVFGWADREECELLKRAPTQILASECPDPAERQLWISKEELILAWMWKFSTCGLRSWRLNELTLDFRQCYNDDGEWLGFCLVRGLNMRCVCKPRRITILAPDLEKKQEVLRILETRHGIASVNEPPE
ncbi:MAG: hypothetical protein L6R38_005003 [Xanthoria sp. 2 TBL-2021]|nr:MAG: hypothetical protein L6R38_005003 [Xanthoria sp. 2 TBL-2021]